MKSLGGLIALNLRLNEVSVSMLEIYNEKVQDLLIPIRERPSAGLRIRESKTLGIFVEGLTKYPVETYEEIERKWMRVIKTELLDRLK